MGRNKKTDSYKYKDKNGIERVASIPHNKARHFKSFKEYARKRAKKEGDIAQGGESNMRGERTCTSCDCFVYSTFRCPRKNDEVLRRAKGLLPENIPWATVQGDVFEELNEELKQIATECKSFEWNKGKDGKKGVT